MARIEQFEDIEAWKKGRELRKAIYGFSKYLQQSEIRGAKFKTPAPQE
jgi:hypothetical protein